MNVSCKDAGARWAQIKRYSDAARRKERPVFDEAVGLARLIGRRPDAEAVFRAAGRYLAMQTYLSIPAPTRRMITVLPAILSRPIALRHVERIAARFLNGKVRRSGSYLTLAVAR